jgi:hypothetical protein
LIRLNDQKLLAALLKRGLFKSNDIEREFIEQIDHLRRSQQNGKKARITNWLIGQFLAT